MAMENSSSPSQNLKSGLLYLARDQGLKLATHIANSEETTPRLSMEEMERITHPTDNTAFRSLWILQSGTENCHWDRAWFFFFSMYTRLVRVPWNEIEPRGYPQMPVSLRGNLVLSCIFECFRGSVAYPAPRSRAIAPCSLLAVRIIIALTQWRSTHLHPYHSHCMYVYFPLLTISVSDTILHLRWVFR